MNSVRISLALLNVFLMTLKIFQYQIIFISLIFNSFTVNQSLLIVQHNVLTLNLNAWTHTVWEEIEPLIIILLQKENQIWSAEIHLITWQTNWNVVVNVKRDIFVQTIYHNLVMNSKYHNRLIKNHFVLMELVKMNGSVIYFNLEKEEMPVLLFIVKVVLFLDFVRSGKIVSMISIVKVKSCMIIIDCWCHLTLMFIALKEHVKKGCFVRVILNVRILRLVMLYNNVSLVNRMEIVMGINVGQIENAPLYLIMVWDGIHPLLEMMTENK